MIALLIGGTVVLCVGVLTIVFGIPIKEFSVGNTMILAGAVVSCTGLVLLGLYFVGRELRNLIVRLDAGLPSQGRDISTRDTIAAGRSRSSSASQAPQPKARARNDTLFPRDPEAMEFDDIDDIDRSAPALPSANSPSLSAPWQDDPPVRTRPSAPVESGERPRRDAMFSSNRRDADDLDSFSAEPPRNGRAAPRRGDAASVSIVKSGVVDSMAYSLYSDGSIEAQMPEGMVRFSSIEELRSHLDQR